MRLGSVYFEGAARIAVDVGHHQAAVVGRSGDACPSSMKKMIRSWADSLPRLLDCLSRAPRVDVAALRWLAPIPDPSKILTVTVDPSDGRPIRVGWKSPASLIGHLQPISLKAAYGSVASNAALALVIGEQIPQRGLRGASVPVFGFSPLTELSCPRFATLEAHGVSRVTVDARELACGLETFSPMGPFLVVDEDIDAQSPDSRIRETVSGRDQELGPTTLLMESARLWLPELRSIGNLQAGDVVTFALERTQSSELMEARGDIQTVIDGIGSLRNPLAHVPLASHSA